MKFWYKKRGFNAQCLRPLSWFYRLIIALRYLFYKTGLFKSTKLSVPVIIVGNLTVGGTGKTPLVIAITRQLTLAGFNVGIISRGYGGRVRSTVTRVDEKSDAKEVGDEALLIYQETGRPVAVCRQRVKAANMLMTQNGCDIIISDDGLQHYALARDIEINLIDQQRGYGNELCLPAGPLREPIRRGRRCHFTLLNIADSQLPERGSDETFYMQLSPGFIYHLQDTQLRLNPKEQKNWSIHAVAAIGNPGRFFAQLRKMGFEVMEHPFADHHLYRATDLMFMDDKAVVMTSKDAVKCTSFQQANLWCLPVEAKVSEGFYSLLLTKIEQSTSIN